jgi:DNA-binding ferritin-like protein (Dps family)
MPALASIEELKEVERKAKVFAEEFPEAYQAISGLLKTHRAVGYKNIIKLLLGESTPEKLKGTS